MITVVIPTRNRAGLLALALESIAKQDLARSRFEVLVIDNGSTDSTRDVIHEYKGQLGNLTGIYAPEPGLHTGRHAGMRAAKGDILVFADDDIEALPIWLSSIHEAFKNSEVAMVGGNNYPLFLQTPPSWLSEMWNQDSHGRCQSISALSIIKFADPPQQFSPLEIWGCNFAIRKDILLKAGGFHPDGMPEELIRFRGDGETHISRYVAESHMKCVFHPGASVYHKVTPERMTYAYFRQRGFNQGVSDSYTRLRQQSVLNTNTRHIFRRVVKSALRKTFTLLRNTGVERANEEFQAGHREGFEYHQRAYFCDAEVRDWVHRIKYY